MVLLKVKNSLLSSRGPMCGQSGYITPIVLWVPNAQRGDENLKWLPRPCLLMGLHVGKVATSPLPSWGSPTLSAGTKIRNGYLAPTVLGGHMRAKWLLHPCRLGGMGGLHPGSLRGLSEV